MRNNADNEYIRLVEHASGFEFSFLCGLFYMRCVLHEEYGHYPFGAYNKTLTDFSGFVVPCILTCVWGDRNTTYMSIETTPDHQPTGKLVKNRDLLPSEDPSTTPGARKSESTESAIGVLCCIGPKCGVKERYSVFGHSRPDNYMPVMGIVLPQHQMR